MTDEQEQQMLRLCPHYGPSPARDAWIAGYTAAPQPARVPLTLPPLPPLRGGGADRSSVPAALLDAAAEHAETYARACAAAWGVTLANTED